MLNLKAFALSNQNVVCKASCQGSDACQWLMYQPPQATWTTSIAAFKPPKPECSILAVGTTDGTADELTQLTWQHLLGPVLSLVFFAGIAIVLKLVLKWCAA